MYQTPSQRAEQALHDAGLTREQARAVIDVLTSVELSLMDQRQDEMRCRWVPTAQRAVPPDADTIIRTITTTRDGYSSSETFWLEGLRGPRLSAR